MEYQALTFSVESQALLCVKMSLVRVPLMAKLSLAIPNFFLMRFALFACHTYLLCLLYPIVLACYTCYIVRADLKGHSDESS